MFRAVFNIHVHSGCVYYRCSDSPMCLGLSTTYMYIAVVYIIGAEIF